MMGTLIVSMIERLVTKPHLSVGLDWTDAESWLINWKEADDA